MARRGFVVKYGPGPITYIDNGRNAERREQRALARIEWILLRFGYEVTRTEDGKVLEVTPRKWPSRWSD
jgi:hypothetical protein